MQTEIVTVTPSMAAVWMKSNSTNRPMSSATYRTYADAMKRGEWRLNGETIKFSELGTLLDGQHRLQAIILSGCSVDMEIRRGLPHDIFDTLDSGKKRKAPDILAISGEKNTLTTAAMLRAIHRMQSGNVRLSNAAYRTLLEQHPEVRYWATKFAGAKALRTFMPALFCAVCHLASRKYGMAPIERFFEQVASGAGLEATDPAYILREKFIGRARGQRFSEDVSIAYCIKAINSFTQGKKIAMLRMTASETMPEIV